MDLHNDWMTDNQIFGDNYENDLLLQEVKSRYEIQRDKSLEGFDAKLNGATTSIRIVMRNQTNSLTKSNSEKYVYVDSDVNMNCGSMLSVDVDGVWVNYIVINSVIDNKVYKSAKMTQCTHKLNVIENNISLEVPCIISKQLTWSLETTKYFELPSNQIYVTVSSNTDTHTIKYNDKFVIGKYNFEVISIDDVTQTGLIVFTMKNTNESIVEPPPTPPISDLVITGSDTITEDNTETYTSNIECVWNITNEDETANDYISIVSQTTTSITLKANNILGEYVIITGTGIEDTQIIGTKTIQVVGLF